MIAMPMKARTLAVALVIAILLSAGATDLTTQAQQSGDSAFGARQLLNSFFVALTTGDLVLLQNGGALSGTIQSDQLPVTLSSGKSEMLKRGDVALVSFGQKSDQFVLTSGELVSGALQMDDISISLLNGTSITLPKSSLTMISFKMSLPSGHLSPGNHKLMFQIFRGLGSQNIFASFAKSLTSFDLAVFPDKELWSGKIVNQQFVFHSELFGTLTFDASAVAAIELAASPDAGSDLITLKSGDRLSGTLDAKSTIQFQPLGLTDQAGQQLSLTFQRGQLAEAVFRLPASAFGGGHGPGFQGGPGH